MTSVQVKILKNKSANREKAHVCENYRKILLPSLKQTF